MFKVLLLAALGFLLHPTASIGEEEPPRLIIDPRGPSGTVKELLFTPDGTTLISLGNDKAIRFWDVASGELRKTLRLQIGDGPNGQFFAGAMSPDGRLLAVGGYPTLWGIRLIDLNTGEVAAVLRGHTNVILSLAFSDDGRWLASGSADDSVRVWDLGAGLPKKENVEIGDSQVLQGHGANVYALDFAKGGERLVSGADDHKLILWKREGEGRFSHFKTLEKHSAEVLSAAFSPDGKSLVSGGKDDRLILWDGETGAFRNSLEEDMEHDAWTIAYSPDGRFVLASSQGFLRGYTAVYEVKGRECITRFGQHNNSVFSSAWHPTEDLVATAGGDDKDIFLWRPRSGEVVHHLRGGGRTGWVVAFGEGGGAKVAFGQTNLPDDTYWDDPLQRTFDFSTLALADLSETEGDPKSFRRYIHSREGKELREKDDFSIETGSGIITNNPKTEGNLYHYSFTPSGDVIVASRGTLQLHRPTGEIIGKFIGHEGPVWAASPSSDGRYLASASSDQTVRLWNLQTGDLLASLFVARDGEWVCWTSDGYFAASPDGGKYIGWHFNKGIDKVAGYLSGEQLYEHFYRPDIVKRAIAENRPSSEIVAELGLKFDLQTALRGAPSVAIAEPAPNSTSPNRRQRVMVEGIDNGGGVAEIRLFNADKRIPPDGPGSFRGGKWVVPFTVSLARGENEIRAVSVNPEGIESAPETIRVKFAGETATSRLHLVAVGLNEYKNPRFALDYCRPDVDAFATSFVEGSDTLFSEVFVHKLFDAEATRAAIETKMKEIASQATPEDVFVFVFAGHGVMSEGSEGISPEFHLVLHDVTQMYGDDEALAKQALSGSVLEELTAAIPARKQLMVLDSCQSGGLVDTFALRGVAEEKAIAQLSRATGMHVLASTRTEQFATETKELGHGLFTYALLEALGGKGDGNGDGRITVKEVEAFLNTRVPELSEEFTGAAQYPNSFGRGQDFPIGLVR